MTSLLFVATMTATGSAATVSSISVYQTDFYGGSGPPVLASEWGDIEAFFDPGSDPFYGYLQVIVATEGPTAWVIRNMPVPANAVLAEPIALSRFFDLGAVGVSRGEPLPGLQVGVVVTPMTIDTEPLVTLIPMPVLPRIYDTNKGLAEGGATAPTDPGTAPAPDTTTTPSLPAVVKILRTDVPDVEEGVNECGPGAITRSLLWLKKRGDIVLDKTTDTLMNDLKTSSSWNAVDGIPSYANTLRAKLAITTGTDVHNKFMVRRPSSVPAGDFETSDGKAISHGDDPTFEFIKKEIRAGEDVEIVVGWLDGAGNRTSGHVMTVIGVTDDPTSGVKEITVQDDRNQGAADATNSRRTTRFVDGTTTQPPKLPDLPRNRVEMVVSESPKPKVTSGTAVNATTLNVSFDRPMNATAFDPTGYAVSGPGQGTVAPNPSSVVYLGGNTFQLLWSSGSMVSGQAITVSVSEAVHDADDNPVGSSSSIDLVALPVGVSFYLVE